MHSYGCADVSNFKYSDAKLFVLKRGSELQSLVKKFQSAMKYTKIQTEFPQSEKFPQSGKPSDGTFFKKLISEGVLFNKELWNSYKTSPFYVNQEDKCILCLTIF